MTRPNCNLGFFMAADYALKSGLFKVCVLTLIALAGGACVSPAMRFNDHAERLGFRLETAESSTFNHLLAHNQRSGERLHIYFGGDGSPWVGGRRVAKDPTPRIVVALGLMALDNQSAVYVGRPCYHDQAGACTPELITNARYSETVVASMEEVVRELITQHPSQAAVLVGFSGGGVLATLVAERIVAIDQVITLAANLDIDAWTEHHGYLTLAGSINPADCCLWRTDLKQLHLTGAQDQNVPPTTLERFRARAPLAEVRSYDRFDHSCCWRQIWPAILRELTDR